MRNLSPDVRQRLAIMLKEKAKQTGQPLYQPNDGNVAPNLSPPPVDGNGLNMPKAPSEPAPIFQQGKNALMPRFLSLKTKLNPFRNGNR